MNFPLKCDKWFETCKRSTVSGDVRCETSTEKLIFFIEKWDKQCQWSPVIMNENVSEDQCNFSYNAFTNDPKVKLDTSFSKVKLFVLARKITFYSWIYFHKSKYKKRKRKMIVQLFICLKGSFFSQGTLKWTRLFCQG